MAERQANLDSGELYGIYIDYIRHENELLNHRTTWFLAIETVLIAAAGYLLLTYFESVVSHVAGDADESLAHIAEFFLAGIVLCAFGLITAQGAGRSIKAALDAQDSLVDHWNRLKLPKAEVNRLPDLMGGKSLKAKLDGGHLADLLVKAAKAFWWTCSFLLGSAAAAVAIAGFAMSA